MQAEVVAAAQEQRERLMGTYTPDDQAPEAPETDDADPGDSQE